MTDIPRDEGDRTAIRQRDPDVQRGPIGTGAGYSGHEYDSHDHAIDKALTEGERLPDVSPAKDDADLPPDAGKRASIAANGEAHGSGMGTGGGSPGEDYASDSATGDGPPVTGKGSR